MKRLGIVGGLGPETGCKFCLRVNDLFRERTNCQPDVVLENVPVPAEVESCLIKGKDHPQMLEMLSKTVKRLNKSRVDFLVIPCNTVHVFIEDLRKISAKPILSIIEETVKECEIRNFKKVGLLATRKTIKEKLYERGLTKVMIKVIIPNQREQGRINEIILRIIHNQIRKEDKTFVKNLIKNLKDKGAEAVILGCTDLPLLIKRSFLPIINTCSVLEKATVNRLIKNTNL